MCYWGAPARVPDRCVSVYKVAAREAGRFWGCSAQQTAVLTVLSIVGERTLNVFTVRK